MVAAYFEKSQLKSKEIEDKNKSMETVIKSLKSVEKEVLDVFGNDYRKFCSEEEARNWIQTNHQQYLAVRLQREKMEQIQKYLATYQDVLHNILSFNLFYSKSYFELTDNLPDPKVDLAGYIDTLVDQISKNQADDDIAAQRQLYVWFFLGVITILAFITSLVLVDTTIGLILMPIGILSAFTVVSCLVIWSSQIMKNIRLDLIKNDCVPTISSRRIRFGTLHSELRNSRDVLLYLDCYYAHDSGKIMCSITEPAVYEETFELLLTEQDQQTNLKAALKDSLPLSDTLKRAISAAIQTRPFSRALPDDCNTEQPRSYLVVSGDPVALKQRFFNTKEYRAFNAETVQSKISELSS